MSKKTESRRHSESSSIDSDSNVKLYPTEEGKQRPTSHSSKSKKSKQRIAPVNPPSKLSAHELFGTDSEDEDHTRHDTKKKMKRATPSACSSEPAHKKSKLQERHSSTSGAKLSARDVFGTDSDDDGIDNRAAGQSNRPPIVSYFSKRLANGLARQTNPMKDRSHFVELKIYKCDEISRVQPMNRWRHAIITIKNKTDDGTDAWHHLSNYIKATRREFKDCRPEIINSNSY